MTHLVNSRKDLIGEVVGLLRTEINDWPLVSGDQFSDVENVWPSKTPNDVEDTFPRAAIDVVSGEDTELSADSDTKLRETVLKVVVFGENPGEIEELVEACEDSISNNWDSYGTDWHFRETDGFTPLVEEEKTEGRLRFNRSINLVFETVKQNE